MNSKLKAMYVGSFLVLTMSMTQPIMADEWNKRTEFKFSGPVEIPGKVLAAGKYVFELAESDSNRNVVEVFSEDSRGKQNLVATVMAIPDYTLNTPDKPTVNFEERSAGSPEAIHSWFYPGDNTGWQFVYPAAQTGSVSTDTTPAAAQVPEPAMTNAPAPVTDEPIPNLPSPPQVQEESPSVTVTATESDIMFTPDEEPAQIEPDSGPQDSAPSTLPQTGGYSDLELMTGFAMLAGGIAVVCAARRIA